jgi:hypothetical protein
MLLKALKEKDKRKNSRYGANKKRSPRSFAKNAKLHKIGIPREIYEQQPQTKAGAAALEYRQHPARENGRG